ncbi:methyl-accepting chemotaxis protein [Aestuariivita boseongensis]|uniref:methyl-accepting chemotaxis protein n=1 Tax=Aestuariivita boseongensis TaxID=1470562 RepID=UPI0006820D98|nr:methyl-accepting chemotaxis protein [Aestuariivita boseongensis]
MILMIAPLISIAGYFVWLEKARLQATIDSAEESTRAATELLLAAELIHELQKERGYSVGFVASEGRNFQDAVRTQRSKTDATWSNSRANLPFLTDHHPGDLRRLTTAMNDIGAIRLEVTNRTIPAPEVAASYTKIVEDVMGVTSKVITAINSGELEHYARASVLMSQAKESAGLERAAGAAGLGREVFPRDVFARFIALQAAQNKALKLASAELGGDSVVDRLMLKPVYARLSNLREGVDEAVAANTQADVTAEEWFDAATDWIDALSALERSMITTVRDNAEVMLADARKTLTRELWLSISITCVVLLIALATFEYVIFRVKRLTRAMQRFTEGEFNVWIPGIKNRDEVGQMASALYHFKQETLAMRKAAEEQKADDEAAILGKAQKVVDLVTEGLGALAMADLSCQFDTPLDPEYDKIRTDFNAANQRLRDVMLAIVQTAEELDQSAQTLMQSSSDLGHRTTEQVDTIASTNDRVSKLSSEVAEFASHVRNASERASSAKSTADRSGAVVKSAVDAMDRIANSSKEIGRIISMIEDITFQTNLLALNAGVEAARAGESGRGFAVVASEVRELAKRSSTATQEIRSLIEDSGKTVEEGVGLVGQAGDSLEDIFAQITEIDEVLGRVAEGSATQATDLQDIANEVMRLNDLASRNIEVVDASGQTSQETARMSKRMTHLIRDFRLQPLAPGSPGRERAA